MFRNRLKELLESYLTDENLKEDVLRYNSWKEAGIISDIKSAVIGQFYGRASSDLLKIGIMMGLSPTHLGSDFVVLFTEIANKIDEFLEDTIKENGSKFVI